MYDRNLYWFDIKKKNIGLDTNAGVLLPSETALDHACVIVEAFEMCSILSGRPKCLVHDKTFCYRAHRLSLVC
jgi:hypothetical protein